MTFRIVVFLLVFFLMLSLALLWRRSRLPLQPFHSQAGAVRTKMQRLLKPRTPLRVALLQPCERGDNRLAQRYRRPSPAMAAGRTTRVWTAREVLSCPLVPISA